MSEDRVVHSAPSPADSTHTQPIPVRRSPPARPKAIPVRRAGVNPANPADPAIPAGRLDVDDAHTDILPVMTDEEFEEAVRAAPERTAQAREAVAETPEPDELAEEEPGEAPARRPRRSFLTGLSGALAAGTVIIALVTIAAQVLSSTHGKPGPGAIDVAGQSALAVLAIVLQRVVDRRRGVRRWFAALGVVIVTAASFGVFWWAWLWLFWSV